MTNASAQAWLLHAPPQEPIIMPPPAVPPPPSQPEPSAPEIEDPDMPGEHIPVREPSRPPAPMG